MATVTSLTETKIQELLAGWQGVALDQNELSALVSQLWTDNQTQNARLTQFSDVTVPDLEEELANGAIRVNELGDNTIPSLELLLSQHDLDLVDLKTVDIPSLQEQLSNNSSWILDFETVLIPDLEARMAVNDDVIAELNAVTIPALESRLGTLESGSGGFDPTALQAEIDALQLKFPITAADVEANTLTANEIAAHTITALEIASRTITALEIKADTLTANEIKAETITALEIAADTITALQIAADTITANEIKAHTLTANEIAADTITALEIASRTITALEIKADTLTANEIQSETITALEIAAHTITALQIKADTITATEIAGQTITAVEIAAETITAAQMDVDNVTTAVMNAGLIQSQLSITGMLAIAGANMGWSAAEGLYLGDDVVFYGDGRTNRVEGNLVTESISIKDGLSIGGNADIHGTLVSANGVTTPTNKMMLGQTWPKIAGGTPGNALGDGETDNSAQFNDMIEWSGAKWLVAGNFFGAFLRQFNKSDLSWAGDLPLSNWKDNFYPYSGLAQVGTSLYVVGSDSTRNNGDYYLYRLSSNGTIIKQNEVRLGDINFFGTKRVRLISDGTNVGLIWASRANGNLILRWYNADLSLRVGSDITLMAGVGNVNVGGAYYGPAQVGGVNRIWMSLQQQDSNLVRAFSTSGAAVTSEDFPRAANASVQGLSYDSADQRMKSFDKYGNMYTYSKYVTGGTLNAQHTLYDGDGSNYPAGTVINGVNRAGQPSGAHETAPGPVTAFALSKRAWPTITAPPAPDELVTDVTQVDKADRLGIYAAVNGTPRLQAYLAKGVRTLPLTDELSLSGALAGASAVPSFSTAMVPPPGRMRSGAVDGAGGPIWDIYGSGLGRMGPFKWAADGRPLNCGTYVSTLVQTVGTATDVVRGGWAPRNSAMIPGSGFSYSMGIFTVSQPGMYFLSAGIGTDNIAQGGGRRATAIQVNNIDVFRQELQAGTTNGIKVVPSVSGVVYLQAGWTIRIITWQNSGSTINTTSAEENNHFSAVCLAAF